MSAAKVRKEDLQTCDRESEKWATVKCKIYQIDIVFVSVLNPINSPGLWPLLTNTTLIVFINNLNSMF